MECRCRQGWPRLSGGRAFTAALALAGALLLALPTSSPARTVQTPTPPQPPSVEAQALQASATTLATAPASGSAVAALLRMGELLDLLGSRAVHRALAKLAPGPVARLSPPAASLYVALRAEVEKRQARRPTTPNTSSITSPTWRLIGPFDGSDGAAFTRVERFEHVVGAAPPAVGRDGRVEQSDVVDLADLSAAIDRPAGAIVHLQRWLHVDADVELNVHLGAHAEARLWLDGERVLALPAGNEPRPLSAVGEAVVRLQKGDHRLHLKLRDHGGMLAAAVSLDAAVTTSIAPPAPATWAGAKRLPVATPTWLAQWQSAARGPGARRGAAADKVDALRGLAALDRLGWPWTTLGNGVQDEVLAVLEANPHADAEVVLARAARATTAADREAIFAAAVAPRPRSTTCACVWGRSLRLSSATSAIAATPSGALLSQAPSATACKHACAASMCGCVWAAITPRKRSP